MSDAARPIVVEHVSMAFGETQALRDVSFHVGPGELFGLIGPDGAGKTTLFRVLTTLLLPASGSAHVLGFDVRREHWAIRSRIGYMPGSFSLYPDLTVAENLAFFASVFGTTVEAGMALIAPIHDQIARFSDRRAEALSGGMKQKLALCCALVHRPELLVLDEPTTGVDAVSRREFWDQLDTLRGGGLPIIVSTPYMDEAVRCDRVALIQSGRILDIDRPAAIGQRFPRPLFAVRSRQRYRLLQFLRGLPEAHSVYPFGEELHYADRRPDAAVADWLDAITAAAGFDDVEVRPVDPGIEDVFMDLMAREPAAA